MEGISFKAFHGFLMQNYLPEAFSKHTVIKIIVKKRKHEQEVIMEEMDLKEHEQVYMHISNLEKVCAFWKKCYEQKWLIP